MAGMEKPVEARGMEGSGTVGIMEARQARRERERLGRSGMARQDRRGGKWRREERRGMGGKGNAGAERTECKGEKGESRQARNDVFRMERKGRDWKRMAGVEWRVRSGSLGTGTAGGERCDQERRDGWS